MAWNTWREGCPKKGLVFRSEPRRTGYALTGVYSGVKNKAPSVIKEVIEARHPESDGGRMLTTKERQDIVRVALSRVAEEE